MTQRGLLFSLVTRCDESRLVSRNHRFSAQDSPRIYLGVAVVVGADDSVLALTESHHILLPSNVVGTSRFPSQIQVFLQQQVGHLIRLGEFGDAQTPPESPRRSRTGTRTHALKRLQGTAFRRYWSVRSARFGETISISETSVGVEVSVSVAIDMASSVGHP